MAPQLTHSRPSIPYKSTPPSITTLPAIPVNDAAAAAAAAAGSNRPPSTPTPLDDEDVIEAAAIACKPEVAALSNALPAAVALPPAAAMPFDKPAVHRRGGT